MYVSQINETGFGNAKLLSKSNKVVAREFLQKKSGLINLNGPKEVKEAKRIVAATAATNAGIGAACAQAPGADEFALKSMELTMAVLIVNGVYHLGFSKGFVSSILTAALGNRVGTGAFKWASKFATVIPGPGNFLNAGIAGVTTYTLGKLLIEMCEKIEKQKNQGKKIEDILKGL